jgi:peptide deformylase
MSLLTIAIHPDPVLRKVAKPVAPEDIEGLRPLLDDMAETMHAAPGVGLAGPQVSVSKRLIVVDVGEPIMMSQDDVPSETPRTSRLYHLINPVIRDRDGTLEWEEGCLSLPELLVPMERSARVTVEALNADGDPITLHGEGLLAIVLQHEIDHLDGKLILDHVGRIKRNLYIDRLKKSRRA